MKLSEINQNLQRKATFELSTAQADDRTIELSFSSEEPVERWFGVEILDHAPESIELGRLTDGGALLVDHDHTDQIGVVESVTIDSETRKGRAVVRFGRSARAQEIYTDVIDGIRKNVSVGYQIMEMREEGNQGDLPILRATKWQPHEISIVSVPADTTVGVGRSQNDVLNQEIIMPEDTKMAEENKTEAPAVDVDAIRAQAVETEQARAKTIIELGNKHGLREMADKFVADGRSINDMKDAVLNEMGERQVNKQTTPATEIGLTQQETQRYSLMKAVRAMATGDWKGAEFEQECSLAIADKLGRDARGLFVPMEVQRDMGTAAATGISDAGSLVGTDHLAGSFIDALRAESLMGRLGARMMDGLVGDVDIPRLNGSATFGWIAEGADATDSDATIGSVSLSPKTIAGAVPMTRRLIKQSSPSVEAIIRQDLIRGAALAIDAAAIAGTGADGQPTGILNVTGVNTQTIADVANVATFAELVGFETALAEDNALMGELAYLTTPTLAGVLKTTAKDSGSGIMLNENGIVNGYRMIGSTQIPAGRTLFGNFNDVMIGMWGVLDLEVDKATLAASGGLVLRAFQDVDVAVRHAVSFCKDA